MGNQSIFADSHAWDRNFYLLFVIACWLGVIMGFEPAVTLRATGKADYAAPLVLQLHVFAFICWLCLLTLQVLLIRFRRVNIHRTLGLIGFALIPVMAVSALMSEIYSQRFYSPNDDANLRFFIFPLTTMLIFPVLAFIALGFRKNPPSHKRMMVLATISIVGSAYYRWWEVPLEAALGTGFWGIVATWYTGFYLLLLLVVLYDLVTRKQIHRVHRYTVPVLAIVPLIASGIYHSEWWPAMARGWLGI